MAFCQGLRTGSKRSFGLCEHVKVGSVVETCSRSKFTLLLWPDPPLPLGRVMIQLSYTGRNPNPSLLTFGGTPH